MQLSQHLLVNNSIHANNQLHVATENHFGCYCIVPPMAANFHEPHILFVAHFDKQVRRQLVVVLDIPLAATVVISC